MRLNRITIYFAALMAIVPLVALAQEVTGSDLNAIAGLVPAGLRPYLALVPVVQIVAKMLAPLPGRVGGFTHATIWSRFWDTVAAFPAAPAPRAAKVASGEAAAEVSGG